LHEEGESTREKRVNETSNWSPAREIREKGHDLAFGRQKKERKKIVITTAKTAIDKKPADAQREEESKCAKTEGGFQVTRGQRGKKIGTNRDAK